MKKIGALVGLLLTFYQWSYGCLNGESVVLKNGLHIYYSGAGNVPRGHSFDIPEDKYAETFKQLDYLFRTSNDFDYLSDKGMLMIILGQYDSAIALYLEIEKLQPNRYSTASNIGTAYELVGQNENALKWITRAIEIDSTSHQNSEWIHARILEAKIKGEKYFTTRFLLDTDFGNGDRPISTLSKSELEKLHAALYFQLHERLSFVRPPEKIVAQLLFDLGNIAFLLEQYEDARGDYYGAGRYGVNEQRIAALVDLSYKLEEAKRRVREEEGKSYFWEIGAGLGAVVVVFGALVYRRTKNHVAKD